MREAWQFQVHPAGKVQKKQVHRVVEPQKRAVDHCGCHAIHDDEALDGPKIRCEDVYHHRCLSTPVSLGSVGERWAPGSLGYSSFELA